MTTGSPREVMRKRQKRRRDFSALAPLLQTPSDFTSSITLTANAKLWVAFDHIETAQLVLDINARELGVPDLAAFEQHCIGWFEKGAVITVKAGVPGSMFLYADAGIGGLQLIATSLGGPQPFLEAALISDLTSTAGAITVARASNGTGKDTAIAPPGNKLVTNIAPGFPRFWADQTDKLGVLSEPVATAWSTQSESLNNAAWINSIVTLNQDQTNVDGATTAWRAQDSSSGSFAFLSQTITVTANTSRHYATCYFRKDADATFFPGFSLWMSSAGERRNGVALDTVTGELSNFETQATAESKSELVTLAGVDWWKVTVSLLNNNYTSAKLYFYPAVATVWATPLITANAAAQGTKIIGPMTLQNFDPSTYIPTTTTAVTRQADVVQGNAATVPNVNDFMVELEWTPLAAGIGNQYIWHSITDNANHFLLWYSSVDDSIRWRKRIAGADFEGLLNVGPLVSGQTYKLLGRTSSATGVDIFVDGVKGTLTSANLTDGIHGSISFLGSYWGTNQWPMTIKNLRHYNSTGDDAFCIGRTT